MAERDRFELDLAAALRDYAVDAPTEVRPTEFARHLAETYPHGRGVTGRWSFGLSPVLAWILLLIGLLVALVAGTLAVGSRLLESRELLPEQPPALLEGMATKEVEPGVFRVFNDGMRDLTSVEAVDILAGYDGGTWLLRADDFIRLGSDGSHTWPMGSRPEDHVFEVTPDGTMWVIGNAALREGPALRSTDGEEWTAQSCPEGSTACMGFTVAPDGKVWASWTVGVPFTDAPWRVSHLGPTGWQALDGDIGVFYGIPWWFDRFFVTDAGDLYGGVCDRGCWLHRYENGVWEEQRTASQLLDVGPDGTVWTDAHEGLARLAGGEWERWTAADLPDVRFNLNGALDYEFEVAPDGNIWFSVWRGGDDPRLGLDSWECDGLARFDGETLNRLLPGQCISMDIAADGSVWVLAGEDEARDLFVITPEAVSR